MTPEPPVSRILEKYHLQTAAYQKKEGLVETPHTPPFTDIVDNVQCYTNYMPRAYPDENSLSSLIVSGMAPESNVTAFSQNNHYGGWYNNIFEAVNMNSVNALKKHKAKGYLDYKHAIYGSAQSGALEFVFTTKQKGYVYICETPGLRKPQHISDNIFNSRLILTINDTTEGKIIDDRKGNIGTVYRRLFEICVQLDRQLTPDVYSLKIRVNQTSAEDTKVVFITTLLIP